MVLDTIHYGGGANTVYDAAACGTPTVTLPGPFHRGRWAAAVNDRLRVPEMTAATPSDYVRMAIRAAEDAEFRADVSRRIRAAARQLFEDMRAVADFQVFLLEAVG